MSLQTEVAELRDTVATLRAEVATLMARPQHGQAHPDSGTVVAGAAMPDPINDPSRPLPPGIFHDGLILRHAAGPKRGQAYNADADTRPILARQADYRADFKAAEAAEETARNAGLPPGYFRDTTGVVRHSNSVPPGKIAIEFLPQDQTNPRLTEVTGTSPPAATPAVAAPQRPLTPYEISQAAADQDVLDAREYDRKERLTRQPATPAFAQQQREAI